MASGDEALISRALVERDTRAFDELVRRHQSRVRGWLRHLTGSPALADDLAQETFIRAWRKLSSYRATGSFEAWLLTIARNEFLQHRRKTGREAGHLERLRSETRSDGPDPGAEDTGGEELDVGRFLGILAGDERDVMMLVYGAGLSHSEASRVMDLPLGTVKSHLRRTVAKIRKHFALEEEGNGNTQ